MSQEVLCAVVLKTGHAPLSKRAQPVLAVLSGTISSGDDLEIIERDRMARPVHVHFTGMTPLSADSDDSLVALDGVDEHDIALGGVVRRPGEGQIVLAVDGTSGQARARLLQAVQWSRAGGFNGPLADLFVMLSDEMVVLFVERRLRHALAQRASPFAMLDAFKAAAASLETIGMSADGDRLLLTAAAALEGHDVGPLTRGLASAAALGTLAMGDAVERAQLRADGVGLALGIEMGDGFAVGFRGTFTAMGEQLRTSLQEEDRAVGLGWCSRCKDVARLDKRLKCATHGKKAKNPVVVVPDDVERTMVVLRQQKR